MPGVTIKNQQDVSDAICVAKVIKTNIKKRFTACTVVVTHAFNKLVFYERSRRADASMQHAKQAIRSPRRHIFRGIKSTVPNMCS